MNKKCPICKKRKREYQNNNLCQNCINSFYPEFIKWAKTIGNTDGNICFYEDGEPFLLINNIETPYSFFVKVNNNKNSSRKYNQ